MRDRIVSRAPAATSGVGAACFLDIPAKIIELMEIPTQLHTYNETTDWSKRDNKDRLALIQTTTNKPTVKRNNRESYKK